MITKEARLILEDKSVYYGEVFSEGTNCLGEVIFNTSMTGYQEVITDPSYKGQLVVMTYPLIGNVGINHEDFQSSHCHLEALIVKEYCKYPSNWRLKRSLKDYLEENKVLGVEGFDTRAITRNLRQTGSKTGILTTSKESNEVLINQIKHARDPIKGKNLAAEVSTKKKYDWEDPKEKRFQVAVIDCGVKVEILNQLKNIGCKVTVYPTMISSTEILKNNYDGILISNGPGDPEPVIEVISLIQELLEKIPLFGICLGHQLLATAVGIPITKLQFGHHGMNHPIKNNVTNKVEISSQNHIYCTDAKNVSEDFEITHMNLNDQTIAGIRSIKKKAFSVQYHPEGAPGPHDSHYLFNQFAQLMENERQSGIKNQNSSENNKVKLKR